MKIIYANIVWFGLLILGITLANIDRFYSEEWDAMSDVRIEYTLLYGAVPLLLAGSIYGLLLKRKWGYELALGANAAMALLPAALFIVSVVLVPELSTSELMSIHGMNLVVGMVSLAFWVSQVRSGVKSKYVPQNM